MDVISVAYMVWHWQMTMKLSALQYNSIHINLLAMSPLILHTCTQSYDPQYGYNFIDKGEVVTIRTTKDQCGRDDIRLITSNRNNFPGFGCRISDYEYKRYFTPIQ